MTLLDSFSKPGWQHRKPEVRKAAIDSLDDEEILLGLIRNDPEQEIRSLALAKIAGSDTLDELIENLPKPLQDQAKAQRLKQLLPESSELSAITDDEALVRIAVLTDDPALITACIERVASPERRLDLACSHPIARIRLAAAQGIKDIDQLKALATQTKNKDKSVYRHCKEHLDKHHAAELAEAEHQQQIQHLADDLRTLSAAADSPEFRARFLALEQRWPALKEHADAETQRRIEDDLAICSKRLEKLTAAIEAEKSQQAHILESKQTLEQIIGELGKIKISDLDLSDPKAIRSFAKNLDAIEDRWVATLHYVHPSAEQTRVCKQFLSDWRAVAQAAKRALNKKPALDSLQDEIGKADKTDYMAQHKLQRKVEKQLQKLSWPEAHKEATPQAIVQLGELHTRLQQHLVDLKKQEKNTLKQLESDFEELRKELDDNHFRNADRVHNRLRNHLRHLGPEHQDHFHSELRPLTARLTEIHDWQGFAIEPKKVELCEQMSALVGSEEEADTLAAKIKALQSEWKKLGPISPRRDQALWRKFHAAAEQAYEPCKAAFARQAEFRKENFRQRMALVAQLIDYDERMAWPGASTNDESPAAPDWRMVQKTLDTARAAFNNIKPVDGKGERKSRKALKQICDKIYGHIKDEYERNIAHKQEFIDQAKALVNMEDLREAINGAKDIQREWKNIGLTPRQVDRKLWKEFRSACDAVFERLDEQRQQQNAARSEQLARVKAEKNEKMKLAKQRALKEQQRWPHLLELLQACALKAEDETGATELWEKEGDIPRGIDKLALKTWWTQARITSLRKINNEMPVSRWKFYSTLNLRRKTRKHAWHTR